MRTHPIVPFVVLAFGAACATPKAPALTGLGDHSLEVTTHLAESQRYFDQGLALSYAFNHAEAARSFREARRRDPNNAMASWGLALALGPNINAPMTAEAEAEARESIDEALVRSGQATPKERALIEAMTVRFDPAVGGSDAATRNQAYADAMGKLAGQFPEDADVCTLAVAAFMETTPWNYWNKDGSPREGTAHAVASLEAVLERHPNHAGAIHYYIHLVEASKNPGRAEAAADRLAALMPGAGHIVHMPSHIYMRVGRYADAANANVSAILADEEYLSACHAQGLYPVGYYPHNIHFLWSARCMQGRYDDAIEAANRVAKQVKGGTCCGLSELSGQDQASTPLYTMVRFGKWREILAAKKPAADLKFSTAVWHYARGMAYAATSERGAAEAELASLRALAADPEVADATLNFDTGGKVLAIAERCVAAEIAAHKDDLATAVTLLQEAVALQDDLTYMEPPTFHLPVRQALGALLLEAERFQEAEAVYEADLAEWPENGWSLHGLAVAQRGVIKMGESRETERRFERAWSEADVKLRASVFR
jgi:tetratricopeptide (TPR) repeat protein